MNPIFPVIIFVFKLIGKTPELLDKQTKTQIYWLKPCLKGINWHGAPNTASCKAYRANQSQTRGVFRKKTTEWLALNYQTYPTASVAFRNLWGMARGWLYPRRLPA